MNLEEFTQVIDTLAAGASNCLVSTNEILESYKLLPHSDILTGLSSIPRGDSSE